jgi:iron-sulfur cluster assembly protein
MLMLTDNATKVIGALVDNPEMPDGGGLRIAAAPEGLTVSPVEVPEATDQVIEEQSARVFVETEAAAALDDKVLDAQVDDSGRVQFMLGQQ